MALGSRTFGTVSVYGSLYQNIWNSECIWLLVSEYLEQGVYMALGIRIFGTVSSMSLGIRIFGTVSCMALGIRIFGTVSVYGSWY